MSFRFFSFLTALGLLAASPLFAADTRPNILLIVADDLGYADVGFQGCKDIPTPHLDALARQSLRCTNGYVTHPFCSPTRAGMLTGRYQQRFGHENNPKWDPADTVAGLPISETTLPQVLKTAGYSTGWVGKWHLGAHPQFHPLKRGFDESYGLLGGGHDYLPDPKRNAATEYAIPMDRNGKSEPQTGHMTELIGNEAVSFVERHKEGKPWFLYLAFNAPHTPLQPAQKDLARVAGITDEKHRKYAGLVVGMDEQIGRVLKTLRDSGQDKHTMIWFFSDNGGPIGVTNSRNTPLRGAKGDVYEGGMRVPFLIAWPGTLPEGKDYDQPVISLDLFATAVGLTGAKVPESHKLEGVDLMPFLSGKSAAAPHDRLYWRSTRGIWAIREGDWKLVFTGGAKPALYHLKSDIAEASDVASANPDVLTRLQSGWNQWNQSNIAPLFESPRPATRKAPPAK